MIETLKDVAQSFYSRAFYANLLRREQGIGMRFVFIMVLVNLLYLAVSSFPAVQAGVSRLPGIASTLPTVTIKDHTLAIDAPSPYVLAWPDEIDSADGKGRGAVAKIVVDTNDVIEDTTVLEQKMHDEQIVALFNAQRMVTYKPKQRELRIDRYETIPDTQITPDRWVRWAQRIALFFLPALFLVLAIGSFLQSLFKVVVGSAIAAIVNALSKGANGFAAAMRLSAASAVPPTFLFLVLPKLWFVRFIVWVGYMVYGAMAAHREKRLARTEEGRQEII